MKRPVPVLFSLLFFSGLVLSSCSTGGEDRSPPAGREGSLRILSLSPNVTEILFALGAGEEIVGVTDFCRFPPEAAGKPKVGGLLNPNLEKMIVLEPNLVILLAAHGSLAEKLASRGIRTLLVRNDTVGDVFDSIGRIGEAVNREGTASDLVDSIMAAVGEVEGGRPERSLPTMIVVSRSGGTAESIYVAGPGTYLDELLQIAGGENVFAGAAARYPTPGIETILRKNPEVIIEVRPEGRGGDRESELARRSWGKLPGLAAFERGNIFVIAGDYLLVPGPRLRRALEDLASALREAD